MNPTYLILTFSMLQLLTSLTYLWQRDWWNALFWIGVVIINAATLGIGRSG